VADLYLANDFVETEPEEATDQSIPGATETLVSEEEGSTPRNPNSSTPM